MRGRSLTAARLRLLCSVAVPVRCSLTPPCAPIQTDLLRAVLSKLPPGAIVSADQLRSLMGVHSRDLCGVPLKQVGGSWTTALKSVLGKPEVRERRPQGSSSSSPQFVVPPEPELQWMDPRPPPEPSTRCLGELVVGSTTWLTNEPAACDELVAECGFESARHIGLDAEWTPTMVRGQIAEIAMLQLATREHCLLVRVGQMPLPLPPRLRALLEASSPLKVGRGIRQDARLIRSQLGANLDGVTELAGRESLKALARTVGGLKPPDDGKWMTNWDARELLDESLCYAAFDSIAAYAVHANSPRGATTGGSRGARTRLSKSGGAPARTGSSDEAVQPTSARAPRTSARRTRASARLRELRADACVDDDAEDESTAAVA